jgi:membrane protease YdiL (CAAX protease family)
VPTVVLTLAVSNGVGLALTAMGFEPPIQEAGNILTDLLRSALLPAVTEEALFRLVPLLLIAPRTRRGAFAVMTAYFALAHGSLFSIPYALVAGAVLAFITLATGNILYAVIIHLLNNVTSVLLMHYGSSSVFLTVTLSVLGVLCAVSAVFIVLRRRRYRDAIVKVLDRGELRGYPKAFYIYTALTTLLAISQLLI